MTIWDVLSAVRRQWLLALAGAIATAVGVIAAGTTPGVYFQEANVVFLAPNQGGSANTYQLPPVVAAAGLVGRQVSARPKGPLPVTTTVTIVDLGIREGALARLPNTNRYKLQSADAECSGRRGHSGAGPRQDDGDRLGDTKDSAAGAAC